MNKLILLSLLLINSVTLYGMLSKLDPNKTLGATLESIIKKNNAPKNENNNDPINNIIVNSRFTHKQGPNKSNNFTESPLFIIVPKTQKNFISKY